MIRFWGDLQSIQYGLFHLLIIPGLGPGDSPVCCLCWANEKRAYLYCAADGVPLCSCGRSLEGLQLASTPSSGDIQGNLAPSPSFPSNICWASIFLLRSWWRENSWIQASAAYVRILMISSSWACCPCRRRMVILCVCCQLVRTCVSIDSMVPRVS